MVWQIVAAVVSAGGQLAAGSAAKRSAELDAFNIETQKKLSETEAVQRHNDRLDQYRYNTKANLAALSATGKDINASRSVEAFLSRQQEIASEDTQRSDLMGMFDAMKLQQQANAVRAEGRATKQAAQIKAYTSLFSSGVDYVQTMQTSGLSKVSVPRPRARPRG